MADITVGNLFANVIKSSYLGYIRIVYTGQEEAVERMANDLSAEEMFTLLNKTSKAYYRIGEYWTIIV